MKWWGWGDDAVTFPIADKPTLWPWIREKLNIADERATPPISRDAFILPPPLRNEKFCLALTSVVKAEQCRADDETRLRHTAGKSYPNLIHMRAGNVQRAPDMIVSPATHEEAAKVIALANLHDVCVIPFGGGTNIVGGIDPLASERRMVVTLDASALARVVSVDRYAMTAIIQAGATGPQLEADLMVHGVSLGHFPDSFEYSTLGGWLATRSAGMQSDAYGRIEDMVVGMRMATPIGEIVTRGVPASAAGPSMNEIILGSEGVLGMITEATMQVHAVPATKDYFGLLFRNFEEGVAAIHELRRRGLNPSMIRFQDSGESELAFHMKSPPEGLMHVLQQGVKAWLRRRGYVAPCIMVVGFEGEARAVRRAKSEAVRVLKRAGGFVLGGDVGKTWSKDKYNIPYLRDFVMDRGIMCDVAETATTWDKVVPLHKATVAAVSGLFQAEQYGFGFVGCHISHTYETGACLYFTYAATQIEGEELAQYYRYKRLVTDTFMQSGATLTHHHAVGSEHLPWMEQEVSPAGLVALRSLKHALDPNGIMNPGKLVPAVADDTASARLPRAAQGPMLSSVGGQ